MQLHPRVGEERPQGSNRHTSGSTLLQRPAVAARLCRMLQILKVLLCNTRDMLSLRLCYEEAHALFHDMYD